MCRKLIRNHKLDNTNRNLFWITFPPKYFLGYFWYINFKTRYETLDVGHLTLGTALDTGH